MKYFITVLALLLAQPAMAQVDNPGMSLSQVSAILPVASTAAPPCIADSGVLGTGITMFALGNHTHCSKARRAVANTDTNGSYTWAFSPVFTSAPVCQAVAEVASGITDVFNAQIVGTPTTTAAVFLVTRTQKSVVAAIGLTVLSVPTSPGVVKLHLLCLEP